MQKPPEFLDLLHIQSYLYLMRAFVAKNVSAKDFETIFLDLRRNDQYLMSGKLHIGFSNLLRVVFNAVDDYAPPELYDPLNKYDITEEEMRKIVTEVLGKFEKKMNR
jgi:hypothetical protein